MPKPEKIQAVAELKARIEASDALLLTEYRGLTVADISDLRRALAEGGARFAVVKNTLMRRAAADAAVADMDPLLQGPTAVAFVAGDPVAAAKKVVEAAKRFPTLVIKGAYMDGRVLGADDARALADLEPRDVMLSKVAGMLKSEMSRAASMFQTLQSRFVGALEAYREKLPGAEPVEVPETQASVDEPATEAPVEEPETQAPVEASLEAVAEGTAEEEASKAPASDGQDGQEEE
ncbi:MAG: 50S ribosomal protein L10 [Actinobacteria bacterium]|nr:50S ribosomal protein L10 [Actinomycetota bacterium]